MHGRGLRRTFCSIRILVVAGQAALRRPFKLWQVVADFVVVRFLADENVAHSLQASWDVERAGDDSGRVQVEGFPKQPGATFTTETTPRDSGRLIPGQSPILGDGDIRLGRFGVRAKTAMQALAHTAVAVHHITQNPSYFVAHRAAKAAARTGSLLIGH